MWKDFFYYSQSERKAILVLLTLIAFLVIAIVFVPNPQSSEGLTQVAADSVELERFASRFSRETQKKHSSNKPLEPVPLFAFDPNLADSIELSRLGLRPYVVRNILKYRLKGGRFSTPESFSRIYGLTESKFNELKPYISISDSFVRKPKPKTRKQTTVAFIDLPRDTVRRSFKYPEGTRVDVNLADTSELKKIPGIGSGIAKMIVAYRSRLGGFYALEQLMEVKYVTTEMLDWFSLKETTCTKIDINKASLDKMRMHPYINFYQAKVIVEHRRKRGEIKSLSQLSLYEEFTEKDLKRLSAYVSFD